MVGFATRCHYCFQNTSLLHFKYIVITYSLLHYMMLLCLLDYFMNHQFKKKKKKVIIFIFLFNFLNKTFS